MEEKKKSRADKMYGNSPKIKKGEDGKVTIGKDEKVASGTDGIKENESHAMEKHVQDLEHKHSKERMDMFHRHEKEHMEMKHKVMKDMTTEHKEEKSGKAVIEKVEHNKKGEE